MANDYALSARAGRSVNDGINPDGYFLHCSSVDNVVAIFLHLGKGVLMAKIDLKSAFRMILVHCTDWGPPSAGTVLHGHLPAIWLLLALFLFSNYAMAIEWIMTHNYHASCITSSTNSIFSWLPLCNPFAASETWTHFSR